MKKITSIQLQNFRAFYGQYEPIVLPNGENLLIYGENGSGKSSLFKALQNYFQSSRDAALAFEVNSYVTAPPPVQGNVQIDFVDVDPATRLVIAGTNQSLTFGNLASNHNVLFVRNTDLIKGFLDYRNLLDVYNHKEARPNLFELIVLDILGAHIPVGETYTFKDKWETLQKELIEDPYNRNHYIHTDALDELPGFQAALDHTLNLVFTELNRLLTTYYADLRIELGYVLMPMDFVYGEGRWEWHTTADLRLQVRKDGVLIPGDYSAVLNEARMSAFAVCLYLASLKINPVAFEYKILFLDDVFIGIDASNRKPILEILRHEFDDYQIFITTYDKYWYELAQRHFKSHMSGRWAFKNLYVGVQTIGGVTFDKPLLIQSDDDYSKAVYYLHHPHQPDYPAAANYFRKYAEGLLTNKAIIPPHETRNADNSLIENFKLSNLVKSSLRFLYKIKTDVTLMRKLHNALPTILHPLSHYNLSSPVYKGELIEIQSFIKDLEQFLKDLKLTYRLFITESRMLKLKFTINATDTGYYDIYAKEAIYLLNSGGALSLSDGDLYCKTCYVISGTTEISRYNFPKKDPSAEYTSLENCYEKVYNHIHGMPLYAHIPQAVNYTTEFLIHDGISWQSLNTQIVW